MMHCVGAVYAVLDTAYHQYLRIDEMCCVRHVMLILFFRGTFGITPSSLCNLLLLFRCMARQSLCSVYG